MSVKQIFNTSAELDYPTVLPTLDLDFANTKTLDPRITFTRSSGGSYVGADGLIEYAGVNEPRFDHDPYTGESLGLLVEEARTNLISNSYSYYALYLTEFETNIGIAPDGTNTASKATPNNGTFGGTTIVHQAYAGITFNGKYTYSAFVKPLVSSWQFGLYDNFNAQSSTITVTLDANGNASATGQDTNTTTQIYPNGWVRIIFTYIANGTASNYLQLYSFGYGTGDGNLKAYLVWGVQYEQGAFPTSYIPTEGSTRTRASDFASITGKNFSDFYNPTESSAFVDVIMKNSTGANGSIAYLFTNSSNYYYGFSRDSVSTYHFVTTSNINSFLYGTLSSNANYKACMAWKQNDINSYINSVQNFNTNSVTLFTPDILYLGVSDVNTNTLNGTIRKFTYYPKRLPNAQLITLTT